jgi:hypothetical protein
MRRRGRKRRGPGRKAEEETHLQLWNLIRIIIISERKELQFKNSKSRQDIIVHLLE